MDEGQRELMAEILRRLTDGPAEDGSAYEQFGEIEFSMWGAGSWVKVTSADGTVTYQRVTVVQQ